MSSLTHGVWQRSPLQPRVGFGLRAEGQDVSGAIPRTGGSAFPGQSFVCIRFCTSISRQQLEPFWIYMLDAAVLM